ncbi:TetR/AcrR family transcriptional regulator [uncultured Arthrobacter sp.]|uniref:TetR/AcrR family transcriptional regulator n=1 Tax=uncultured Arthrobacter sp. TaxID=114050 RepID=UPI0025E27214|nr:TetR/AcrR family transcriptional regulator [uncultured Arthrobacter sp.]
MAAYSADNAPTTRKGRATRERIIEVAARLMQDRGVSGTTLEEVEAAAAVGRSQMYHYFAGKDDLVGAVIDHQIRGILASQASRDGLSSWRAWEEWRDHTVEHSSKDNCAGGCPLGSLASELAEISEEARGRLSASFLQWEESFHEGLSTMKSQGLLSDSADPARLAIGIMTSLEGGLLMSQTHRDRKYLEIALDGALGHVRAVGAPPHQLS